MGKRIIFGFTLFLTLSLLLGYSAGPVYGFYYDNPGEEAFSTTKFELLLPDVAFGAKNNLFNLENINIDLTQPGAKADFLGQMSKGYFKSDFYSQLKAGLTIGRFSVHLRPWATGSFRLAPGVPELIFYGYGPAGNDINATKSYNLTGTKLNGLAALSLDFKYGHPISLSPASELGVGVNFRYVQGLAMFHSEVSQGTLVVNGLGDFTFNTKSRYLYAELPGSDDEDFSPGQLFSNPPGRGFLMDLGVVYNQDPYRAGLVLKNIGALKWQTVQQGTYEGGGEVKTGPNGPEFDGKDVVSEETTLTNYTMTVPIVLQLQGSYRFLKNLYWHVGMETGLADGWGISGSPCLQTGIEWRPRHLIRLAGDLAYHDRHLNYQALLELKLLCFWLRFQVGWVDQFNGVNAAGMFALHF
ncbi:MAG TPA: hypothetical protein GXZ98_05465 [Firmicutes bacterium]|jgi:hypothetical protein|nr:hypothetical protein [Bacillota bacterium]